MHLIDVIVLYAGMVFGEQVEEVRSDLQVIQGCWTDSVTFWQHSSFSLDQILFYVHHFIPSVSDK